MFSLCIWGIVMASSDNLNTVAQKGGGGNILKRRPTQSPQLIKLYCIIIKRRAEQAKDGWRPRQKRTKRREDAGPAAQ